MKFGAQPSTLLYPTRVALLHVGYDEQIGLFLGASRDLVVMMVP